MAIFTTLITGAKLLAKKFAKDKLKKKAKEFVGGKKKKKEDKKKEKRQAAKNIMQEQGVYAGGGAIVATPTKALVPTGGGDKGGALAIIDKGPIDFKVLNQKIDNITEMTGAIAMLTGTTKKQVEDEAKARKAAVAKAKREAREKKLESKKGLEPKSQTVKKKGKGPLDFITNFLMQVALGSLVLFLMNNIQKIQKGFEFVVKNWDKFFWVFRAVLFDLFNGFGLTKQIFKLLGKGAVKTLKFIAKPFKWLGGLIGKKLAGLGAKIVAWAKGGIAAIKAAFLASKPGQLLMKGVGKVKQTVQATKAFVQAGATKVKDVAAAGATKVKDIASQAKTFVSSKASKVFQRTKDAAKPLVSKAAPIVKKAKGVASKATKPITGGLKVIKRFFGPKAAQGLKQAGPTLKPIAKASKGIKIPIIGPLLVAITSMLADDPLEQTLFKAIGAGLGGLLGSFGGPLGMILGEILGEFVGDLLYTGFMTKGGWSEAGKKFMEALQGLAKSGKTALNWITGGFGRFWNMFMEKHSKWGVPNPVALANPFVTGPLLWKGFFSSEEKEEKIDEGKKEKEDVTIDNSKKKTPAEVDTNQTSDAEGSADAVSSKASYEDQGGDGTIVLDQGDNTTTPSSNGGDSTPLIVPVGSKEALNSYYKAQVTGSLYKVG